MNVQSVKKREVKRFDVSAKDRCSPTVKDQCKCGFVLGTGKRFRVVNCTGIYESKMTSGETVGATEMFLTKLDKFFGELNRLTERDLSDA